MKIKTFTTVALLIFLLVSAAIIYFGLFKTPLQSSNIQDNLSLIKKDEQNLTVTPIVDQQPTTTPTQTSTPVIRPPVRTSAS
ncbi:Uncharacterised protein [uncultured archaeon]|nr:Uncharacterised protein [uncultured archaeon]